MEKKILAVLLAFMLILPGMTACGSTADPGSGTAAPAAGEEQSDPGAAPEEAAEKDGTAEQPSDEADVSGAEPEQEAADTSLYDTAVSAPETGMLELEKNLCLAKVGDCGFSAFLEAGGASSDAQVVAFLTGLLKVPGLDFESPGFGCSTIAVSSPDGGHFFGRNFDWSCNTVLLLEAHPKDAYASFSTVNVDFIRESAALPNEAIPTAAYYAPLDGMNEKGLCVSVNMISDSARINQKTDLPDLTTTTALRLLLDRAATTDEALELLREYDLHGSYDMMIHFAVSDAEGHAAAVEYVNQEMVVIETPILTNFYLSEGEKHGVGAEQSHRRFEVLEDFLEKHRTAAVYEVRDALKAAGESNFDPDPNERTEWSVIYDQTERTGTWYRRENFKKGWTVALGP